MNMRALLGELKYLDEVESKRQTYYVFEGRKNFVLMTFSRNKVGAGNFTVVDKAAVEYVASRFAGKQGITSNDIVQASRKPQYIRSALDALNIVYAMIATRRAKIDGRYKGKQLRFNVRE